MTIEIINEAIEILKKYKDEGSKIVGIVQHGIFPDELVLAAGAIPLRLILGGEDEQEIGDQYLSATTCPFGRATLGFLEKQHPLYSFIDTVIVGTFCNGVQNVSNYLEYFKIPSMPIIIPHRSSGLAFDYYLNELHKLTNYLEQLTGNKITTKNISVAIKEYNQLRSLFREINDFRKNPNPPVCGQTIHQLVCQALLLGPKYMIPKLQNVLQQLEDSPSNHSGTRIFLTGSVITLGDPLIKTIEELCGGLVVADDLCTSTDYFLEDVDITDSDPFRALATRYLCRNLCGRMIPDSRIPTILNLYREFRAYGIINHTLKFCDSYSNLKTDFRKEMANKNIPVLDLDRDYAESTTGQIQTRIEAFLEMID